MSTEEAVTLQLQPQQVVKLLSVQLLLQNSTGQQLYGLSFDANTGVKGGDMEVALKDTPTSNNILNVNQSNINISLLTTVYTVCKNNMQR